MKKIILIACMLVSVQAFAQAFIPFSRVYPKGSPIKHYEVTSDKCPQVAFKPAENKAEIKPAYARAIKATCDKNFSIFEAACGKLDFGLDGLITIKEEHVLELYKECMSEEKDKVTINDNTGSAIHSTRTIAVISPQK